MGKRRNYSKMYSSEEQTPVVEEPVFEEETPEIVTGIVTDCTCLNMREHPDRKAEIISVLPGGSEVRVNISEKLDEWYHVYTVTGLDGFCMRQYIAVEG